MQVACNCTRENRGITHEHVLPLGLLVCKDGAIKVWGQRRGSPLRDRIACEAASGMGMVMLQHGKYSREASIENGSSQVGHVHKPQVLDVVDGDGHNQVVHLPWQWARSEEGRGWCRGVGWDRGCDAGHQAIKSRMLSRVRASPSHSWE
jgi:hypothetical protein